MKIIYNNIIPFKGFSAMNLFGVLFVRKGVKISERLIRHETIHTLQMRELWYIGFYLLYALMWVINLFIYGPFEHKAYRNITFEKEAYLYENSTTYLKIRRKFNWIRLNRTRI